MNPTLRQGTPPEKCVQRRILKKSQRKAPELPLAAGRVHQIEPRVEVPGLSGLQPLLHVVFVPRSLAENSASFSSGIWGGGGTKHLRRTKKRGTQNSQKRNAGEKQLRRTQKWGTLKIKHGQIPIQT